MDPWEKKKWLAVVALVLLCVTGSWWQSRENVPEKSVVQATEAGVPEKREKIAKITVYISGAVQEPGLYQVKPGIRYQEALEEAGGATKEADLTRVNLAKKCKDGSQVNVPYLKTSIRKRSTGRASADQREPGQDAKGGAGETAQSGRGTEKDNRRINLNRAGEEELTRLPGIGPALARRIVEYRQQAPFRRVEDLQQVSGIGPSKFQRLKPLVEV